MPQLVMLKGLSGSGKSTYAKEALVKAQGYKRINKDDLRAMIDESVWSRSNEKAIVAARDALIQVYMARGYSIVIDDTNLAPRHPTRLKQLVDEHNATLTDKKEHYQFLIDDQFLAIPINECIENDLKRPNSVGARVIRQQYRQFLAPKVAPTTYAVPREGLPQVILCDLDGTLCNLNGRNPYATEECGNDTLNQVVHDILHSNVCGDGSQIIFVSGRKEKFRPQTIAWLEENLCADVYINMIALYMRGDADDRKDSIVKKEIFFNNIFNRYEIKYVLDDRDQVVDMWRNELGLTVLQVADGDF